MTGVLARILLRVGAGILIGKGIFAPDDINAIVTDIEVIGLVETALGGIVWAGAELYYWAARRWGWAV